MQISFGCLVKKMKTIQWHIIGQYSKKKKKKEKIQSTVFEGTVITLSLSKISKCCLLSKTISLFPYSRHLTTENLMAARMEKPRWYF